MSVFEDVKRNLNITQVIEYYGIKVNRYGKFLCPFHNDHKPSASIKNDYFNCFVCGAGGDLITFTSRYLGMSNIDACKELIKAFHLNIDINNDTDTVRRAQERKIKNEVQKCTTLRDKFNKDRELRQEKKTFTLYGLRNDVRNMNKADEENVEKYIDYVGNVLADIHRYMYRATLDLPIDDERHVRALQELTTLQYWIDMYDNYPREFCDKCSCVINYYEKELIEWNQC